MFILVFFFALVFVAGIFLYQTFPYKAVAYVSGISLVLAGILTAIAVFNV